jgi:hypothetical protein
MMQLFDRRRHRRARPAELERKLARLRIALCIARGGAEVRDHLGEVKQKLPRLNSSGGVSS